MISVIEILGHGDQASDLFHWVKRLPLKCAIITIHPSSSCVSIPLDSHVKR
jgi:hypothetical protein